jgi:hypothetical protein
VSHPGWAEKRNGEKPRIVAHIAYDGLRGNQVDVVTLTEAVALRLAAQCIQAVTATRQTEEGEGK